MTELERLDAIEAIKHLKALRLRALDEKRWVEYEAMHEVDHVSDTYESTPVVGAKACAERVAQVLEGVISIHHAHSPAITILSATEAEGVWAMEDNLFWKQGAEDHWLRGYGYYEERYRRGEAGWRFCYRRLRRLHVITSPGAIPRHLASINDDRTL